MLVLLEVMDLDEIQLLKNICCCGRRCQRDRQDDVSRVVIMKDVCGCDRSRHCEWLEWGRVVFFMTSGERRYRRECDGHY